VADDLISISTRLEAFDEERYLRETGQLIARYAASGSFSEGRVVLDMVRIATACGLRTPPELSLLGKACSTWKPCAGCWHRSWIPAASSSASCST
jgi:hypothetical protein